jgi:hypothetical protein
MDVKCDLLVWGKNINYKILKAKYSGKYLGLRGMKQDI